MAAVAVGFVSSPGVAAAAPPPKQALAFTPVQDAVEYQRVEPEQVEACRVVDLERDDWAGWRVLDPDGMILRRYADTDGDKKVDLWCYYQYGVEVYRDIDGDGNRKADQYRWLGTGGTRWGIDDDEDGTIDRWKMISPEEVSAELVRAVRGRDPQRFARLLATREELEEAGLGEAKVEELAEKADRAARDFEQFVGSQKAVGPEARWVQFAAPPPGVVPAGTDGLTRDLVVYENAVAMFEENGQSGQLVVGTMIRIGDAWRLVELPSVVRAGQPVAQPSGIFFTPGLADDPTEVNRSPIGEQTQQLVNKLEAIDRRMTSGGDRSAKAKLHAERADILERLIESAGDNPDERETWVRQFVDTVSVAAQTGEYPEGVERLQKIARQLSGQNETLAAYAKYSAIETEYMLRQSAEDADFAKNQEWYNESLAEFVDRYPDTSKAAAAMLQLALSKEFEAKEKEALSYYRKVASSFQGTRAAEKAAGAIRRLESVGQSVQLEGTTLGGKAFKLSQLRGKPVVLHYWATWCTQCLEDMKRLRRLEAQYQRAGLEIVGVNVDGRREPVEQFVSNNQIAGIQLFEPGGLESSPLALQFGVQTLPTMMLIDRSGKVVEHNILSDELPDALDALMQSR